MARRSLDRQTGQPSRQARSQFTAQMNPASYVLHRDGAPLPIPGAQQLAQAVAGQADG